MKKTLAEEADETIRRQVLLWTSEQMRDEQARLQLAHLQRREADEQYHLARTQRWVMEYNRVRALRDESFLNKPVELYPRYPYVIGVGCLGLTPDEAAAKYR